MYFERRFQLFLDVVAVCSSSFLAGWEWPRFTFKVLVIWLSEKTIQGLTWHCCLMIDAGIPRLFCAYHSKRVGPQRHPAEHPRHEQNHLDSAVNEPKFKVLALTNHDRNYEAGFPMVRLLIQIYHVRWIWMVKKCLFLLDATLWPRSGWWWVVNRLVASLSGLAQPRFNPFLCDESPLIIGEMVV